MTITAASSNTSSDICPQCTYRNEGSAFACSMCDTVLRPFPPDLDIHDDDYDDDDDDDDDDDGDVIIPLQFKSASLISSFSSDVCRQCTYQNERGSLDCLVCGMVLRPPPPSNLLPGDGKTPIRTETSPQREMSPKATSSSSSSSSARKRKRGETPQAAPAMQAGASREITFSEHVDNLVLTNYSAAQRTEMLHRVLAISQVLKDPFCPTVASCGIATIAIK
jgi:ribosomal protein L40E